MAEFLKAKIIAQTRWAAGLVTLKLDTILPEFLPGQFAQLALDSDQGRIKRSYSIASAPGERAEFFISEVKAGALSPSLVRQDEEASLLLDPVPLGFFTLEEVPECKSLWLVSTGTGLGPTISMLRTPGVLERFEKVFIVHGAPRPTSLAYREEILALCDERIAYLPCLSQEAASFASYHGRITSAFADGSLEKWAGESFGQDSHMLLCGNPTMIDEMAEQLKARGFEKHRRRKPGHFNFERYW